MWFIKMQAYWHDFFSRKKNVLLHLNDIGVSNENKKKQIDAILL